MDLRTIQEQMSAALAPRIPDIDDVADDVFDAFDRLGLSDDAVQFDGPLRDAEDIDGPLTDGDLVIVTINAVVDDHGVDEFAVNKGVAGSLPDAGAFPDNDLV